MQRSNEKYAAELQHKGMNNPVKNAHQKSAESGYSNGNSYQSKDAIAPELLDNCLPTKRKLQHASSWSGLFQLIKSIVNSFMKEDVAKTVINSDEKAVASPKKRAMEYEKEMMQNPYNKKYKVYN